MRAHLEFFKKEYLNLCKNLNKKNIKIFEKAPFLKEIYFGENGLKELSKNSDYDTISQIADDIYEVLK